MTQSEFAQGWKLLIVQPWGKLYRSLNQAGAISEEAKTQLEFYYSKLKFGHPTAWMKVAELYAEGKEWPSIQSLREALTAMNRHYVKAIEEKQGEYCEMPEELRNKIGNIGKGMPT